MKRWISLLVLICSFLVVTSAPLAAADSDNAELLYLGQMTAITSIFQTCIGNLVASTSAYDGSASNQLDIIVAARCLVMLDGTVQGISAPDRFADTHRTMQSATTHYRKAGEYLEYGLVNGDAEAIGSATEELTLGNDDLEDATDELEAAK